MKKAAFITTYIGLLLPYRLRIAYGFLLNFTLAPLNLIRQVFGFINNIILLILLFLVYYLIISFTVLLRPKNSAYFKPVNEKIGQENIFRMF